MHYELPLAGSPDPLLPFAHLPTGYPRGWWPFKLNDQTEAENQDLRLY